MKKQLSILEYNCAEHTARRTLPAAVLQTFEPVWHLKKGESVHVEHDSELSRYIESPLTQQSKSLYDSILGGMTIEEFDEYQKFLGCFSDFTEEWFGRVMLARQSPLKALNVLRHIRYIFGVGSRPRILEINPGHGLNGTLINIAGLPYAGTDFRQAYYVYQNHLWNCCSQGNVTEFARYPMEKSHWSNFNSREKSEVPLFHIPWWEFYRFSLDSVTKFDGIVLSGTLAKLSLPHLRFIVAVAREVLTGVQASRPCLLIDDFGTTDKDKIVDILKVLYEFGFIIAHKDELITVFTLVGLPIAENACSIEELKGNGFTFSSPQNQLSQIITRCREIDTPKRVIPYEQLETLYTLLVEGIEHRSEAEKFLGYINYAESPR